MNAFLDIALDCKNYIDASWKENYGNFLQHEVIKYFDYETVGDMKYARYAHVHGFFVGNHPHDLRPQLDRLREVLNAF